MLETEPQATVYAARPRSSSHRLAPAVSGASAARALPSRGPMPPQDGRQVGRDVGERTSAGRVPRSEARLLTWTVACAIVVSSLLVLYLAAYAHLTILGIEQSKASRELRDKSQQNQMLRAQEAALENPDRIAARAARLGLIKNSPRVDYIRPVAPAVGMTAQTAVTGEAQAETFQNDGTAQAGGGAGSQGMNSGPKSETNLAARND